MNVNKVTISNFTVFENISIDFSSGINILIGENGTGKTHLLKLMYSFCQANTAETVFIGVQPMLSHSFFMNIEKYFLTTTQWIRDKGKPCTISFSANDVEYAMQCEMNIDKSGLNVYNSIHKRERQKSVFIPAKEMLTHSGIEKDYATRKLPFDKTYIDILNQAGVSFKRDLPSAADSILNKIVCIIGGRVFFENNTYFVAKGNKMINFSLEAEGNKKFGLLYRLIETGELGKDAVLFWDEPESNINPKLMPDLVDILFDLEKMGVQIFLATHNYIFAKYLDIRKSSNSKVMFYSLYESADSIKYECSESFSALENNSIIGQSIELYKEEIRKVME